jgi:hypothetical protein
VPRQVPLLAQPGRLSDCGLLDFTALGRAPAKGASGGLKWGVASGRAKSGLKLQRSSSRAGYQAAHQTCILTDGDHTRVER